MMHYFKLFALTIAIMLGACSKHASEPSSADPGAAAAGASPMLAETHSAEIEQWRAKRIGNLTKPDGWLSLVGLHWLTEGEQTLGAGADRAVVLAVGPEKLGSITVAGTEASLALEPGSQGIRVQCHGPDDWIDLPAQSGAYTLKPDSSDAPCRLLLGEAASIALIERGGKLALRVKDANAATRTGFAGIPSYEVDASWRIEADWTAHDTMQEIEIQNVLGMIEKMPNPGYASFSRDGKEFRLYPVIEAGETDYFFIFADRTSGRETYGPGRFFYAAPAADGRIVLDFNKAYNPPCAFTEYSTCPLPPPENRLDLAVTAGEKKYLLAGH